MPRGPFVLSCLLFSLFLSTSPILAQEPAVSLQDPSYLPGEGNLISDTGFSYQRETSQAYVNEKFVTGSQSFQYGLLKDLVVGIGESCAYREETQSDFFGTYKQHRDGCNDPYVQAIYRALHQGELSEFPVNIDLAASFSPNVMKATNDGLNTAPGATTGDVNVALSHVFEDVTVLGRIGVQLSGKAKFIGSYYDLANDDEQAAYARPYLEFVSQYRPFADIFVTGGVKAYSGYSQADKSTVLYLVPPTYETIGTTFEKFTDKVGYLVSPYVGVAWTVIPDFLSASIRYQHDFNGKSSIYQYGSLVGEQTGDASNYVAIDFRVLWF